MSIYRKNGSWNFSQLATSFWVQDCCSLIAHVEYQGQARKIRIIERKPLIIIDTSYHIQHRYELKYFHFAQFLLIAHRAAHQPRKSENWELEILDRSWRSSYGQLVSNTEDDFLRRQIFKLKIEACPVNAGHYTAFKHSISFATNLAANFGCYRFRIMPDIVSKLLRATIWSRCAVRFESEQTPFPRTGRISFATDLAANFGCNRFRIMPDIVSKILRAAIWSRCAVRFESEQTPFPRTGRRFRPAALHRIRFGTCVLFLCIFLLRD